MIKNIIFDMGGVLVKFDKNYFVEAIGITDPEDKKILIREVYESLEWAQMDRGSLTDREAADIISARVPKRLQAAVIKLTCDWERPILPVEGMAELIKELKESGYNIYLLSNASCRQKAYWNNIPGSEYFDGKVVSYEEHVVKPQPEIYKILCNRFNLVPSECAFIDDSIQNAESAFTLGINPIVFHGDIEEVRQKLFALGVKISL